MTHLSQATLTAVADGELPAGSQQRVEKHLYTCSRCQHELVLLRNVRSRLRLLEPPTPPGDLAHRLMSLAAAMGPLDEHSPLLGSSIPLGSGSARLGQYPESPTTPGEQSL
ncbi:zf-HC2 domain-containing protein [Saxibacter everestensis]|uniref:Zf-HC2 domain-containing protein n=1 Tax=Saxibacter everestensis TaxID=2909229 RepID=A0ABY8QP02_9MICO|nr:zf-HC2 domain-containing protein [Brevibacteriaceae bacterium ZFBP1038]